MTDATAIDDRKEAAAAPRKISLVDQIVYVEQLIGDIDTWERVRHSEGEALHPDMAQKRAVLRKVVSTLDLVLQHQPAFIDLVMQARERARLGGKKSNTSIARTSDRFTIESEPSESSER